MEKNFGFLLKQKQNSRIKGKIITVLDFADDIALINDEIDQAQRMLSRVESAAARLGLIANAKININQEV